MEAVSTYAVPLFREQMLKAHVPLECVKEAGLEIGVLQEGVRGTVRNKPGLGYSVKFQMGISNECKTENKRYTKKMTPHTIRDRILAAVQDLPIDATYDDAIERLVFLAKIEAGISELDAGKGIPHAEVKRRLGM